MAKWGFLGCGSIARGFAEGLKTLDDAELIAVGARDADRAQAFATEFGALRSYDSYQAVMDDEDVDVIYVATTHHNHVALSIAALESGKAVLCEKPVALNATQFDHVLRAVERHNSFFMEAMWTRFIPAVQELQRRLASGVIGDVQLIQADFGIDHDWDPRERMLNPELGGGSLLDLGIYPITFASMLFQDQPENIHGFMQPAPETGWTNYQLIWPVIAGTAWPS